MILWPILALMTLAAVAAVWWPLARRQKAVRSGSDVAVYRDQLDEIDRDEAASLIGGMEAEAARVEVSRRLIAAAEAAKVTSTAAAPAPARRHRWATLAAAIIVLPLGAGLTYLSLGSPNLKPVSMNVEAGGERLPEGIEQTVAEVEKYLEANPKNGRGWELLAPVYLRLGRFDDAVRARRNALEIFGPDAARLGDLGEAIVVASNGVVTPEAKTLFERANATDSEDVMARYYLGLSAKQEGRRDEAVKLWTALISGAREGAEWLPMVRNSLARVDEKGPTVAAAAPSAAAITPPEHNGDAIEAMVARLAERLKKDGSDVPGWVQLVRSYRALGRTEKANAAVADARAALASDQDALRRLDQGLQGLETEAAATGAPNPRAVGPASSAAAVAPPEHNGDAIEGMVARLAERLKKDGSDIAGWVQLVRSYRVLGRTEKAKAAVTDAHAALASNPEALQQLDQGLQGLETEAAASGAPGSRAATPAPPAATVAPPGPDAGQVAAAAQMAPGERNNMIEGMVARLAQRMAENGSDVDGWLRLIKAYTVLGERDKALTAAASARTALAGNSDNLRRIGELTKELGLEGS
jgi:cytochrome c-type biogenesis protein CcmH